MQKTLIIVESPAKAKKIQEFLGDKFIVMASKGHIADLAKGGNFGMGIDIKNNFKPKYLINSDKIELLNILIESAKQCDLILLMPDNDREGEAISWHLQQRLKDLDIPIKRATFNKITKPIILKAIKEAGDVDLNMFHSQECRRMLDRIVGFTASPFLLNNFGKNLSAGRVQSVVSRMIVDRDNEIKSFKPETFFTITTSLEKDKKIFTAKYPNKITDEKIAKEIKIKLNNKEYIISNVISAEELKYPPPPMITSTLQRICSKEYELTPDKTMKAAQALYENGYVSYIRTDSVRVSQDGINDIRSWLSDNKYEVPIKQYEYKNKDNSQDAHEAIYPTNITTLPNDKNNFIVDENERLVYEVIWKYFVASQMMPATYDTIKVSAHVKDDPKVEVKTSGKALKIKGYLEILGTITDDTKIDLPLLEKGDIVNLKDIKLEKKQTQPPPRYSDDKLIKELENKNIGRPSTFATLLETITHRNYVEKIGSTYHSTELGRTITDVLVKYFAFLNYDFSAKLEQKLDDIAIGKISHLDMLNEFYPLFKEEINKAYKEYGAEMCDKCNSPMAIRNTKKGDSFLGCTSFPRCVHTKNITKINNITQSLTI